MTARTVARRYASALFDVADKSGIVDRADRDLRLLRDLLADYPELARVFESPAIPAARKRAIVEALLPQIGLSGEVQRLVLMLAERDRLMLLPEIVAGFTERLNQTRRIVSAEVVTASPLPDAQRAALTAALGRAADSQVTLTEKVDPAIIGGIVARVGSVVFDASVTRQMERLKQRLLTS
jgi:F-type H+-transporting ATPase subunit delta